MAKFDVGLTSYMISFLRSIHWSSVILKCYFLGIDLIGRLCWLGNEISSS